MIWGVPQINSISQNTRISPLILQKLEEVADDKNVCKLIVKILEVERNPYTARKKNDEYEKILGEVDDSLK